MGDPDDSSPTSDQIVRRAVEGDTSDLWHLTQQWRAYLKLVAQRVIGGLGQKDDASDIVQRGLGQAFENFQQFHGETIAQWHEWLVCIVRNEALDLALGHYNLTLLALTENDLPQAEVNLREAVSLFEALVQHDRRDMDQRYRLAVCRRAEADLAVRLSGDFEDARRKYMAASELIDALAKENPDVTSYQVAWAENQLSLAQLESQEQSFDSALERLLEAQSVVLPLLNARLHVSVEAVSSWSS